MKAHHVVELLEVAAVFALGALLWLAIPHGKEPHPRMTCECAEDAGVEP